MALTPSEAATRYATALSGDRTGVADDEFLRQMRTVVDDSEELRGVRFTQAWKAEPVRFALRTSDGGALVFVTLERTDTYRVAAGRTLTWPDGSPQKAYLPEGVRSTGRLDYRHQVLLRVPAGQGGQVRALGQWGGVVGGDGS